MTEMTYGIVVGYDGSPGSGDALRWAAREAKARDTTLTVCLAWTPDHMTLPAESDLCDLVRQHGQVILARGLPYAESVLGPGRVRAELAGGSAAYVLCERSKTADIVVVGSRGHSELPGLRLGSVAWQVAGHACGRVVVIRGEWRPANQSPGPVLVGVDGSPAAQAATAFAFEEAALRDVPLVAVCALTDSVGRLGEAHQLEEDFGHLMACEAKEHPDVTVVRRVLAGTPRAALLTASADAQMLVVGARGRDGVEGMRLGSVAQAVLHHAPCPVAVVRLTRGRTAREAPAPSRHHPGGGQGK
jgi:nucleotide-binding universal stress UspA family protein